MSNHQTYFHPATNPQVTVALEQARLSGKRVRFMLGDTATGRDWMEENDVAGYIGRSSGTQKVPILLERKSSDGGGALLEHCIIRLFVDGKEVYRHPLYKAPNLTIKPETFEGKQYTTVYRDGEPQARFKTDEQAKAERWVAYMRGERMAP